MGKATTTKRINQGQLLGQVAGDTMRVRGNLDSDEEKEVEVEGMSDQEVADALGAYVYDDNHGRPQSEVGLRAARQKSRAVLQGQDTFTAQEMQRAVARLILRTTGEDE